jgi:hypothetical protein
MSPLVWQRLISSETNLAQLHEFLPLAFASSCEHLHLFHIYARGCGCRSMAALPLMRMPGMSRFLGFGCMTVSDSGMNITSRQVGS